MFSGEELIKLRKAVESSGETIFMTDREGIITYVNPEFTRVYGYSDIEVVGKVTARILKSGVMKKEDYEIYWKTILAKQVVKGELINKTKDGRLINVEGSANPVLGENGEIIGFLAIQRDITERKRMENDSKESEERHRIIFDGAMDGILLADLGNKKFFTANKMICQMTGYSEEEIKSLGVADIHPEKDLPYVIEQFEKQARRGITIAKDIPVKRKDGSVFYADVNSSPVTLAGKVCLLGIFRDVTERKRMEEELMEKVKELEEFQELSVGRELVMVELKGRLERSELELKKLGCEI